MIPEDKKKALIALGLSEEALSLIETRNATDAQKAVAEGIQRKENGVTTPPATTETAPVATATSAANTETPATVAVATATATPATTPEESKDTELAEIKSLLKDLGNAMVSLAQEVAVVKTAQANQEKQIKETVVKELSVTPVSSIDALVNSIIGKADARVDGRDSLAKSKPAETKPTYEPGPTLVPFVNQFLADPAKK